MALDVPLSRYRCEKIDPGHSGGPITVVFPSAATLQEGDECGIYVPVNDSTPFDLEAFDEIPKARIMDPTDRTATPTDTVSGVIAPLGSIKWVLFKEFTPDDVPQWFCTQPYVAP